MNTPKMVFCCHCNKELPEEHALYVRATGKFFCNFACMELHHPQHQTKGIVEIDSKAKGFFATA